MPGLKGKLLGLQSGGVNISCEISCDFNFQVDMIGASAVDSARWKEVIPGLRSWTVNVSGQLLAEAVGADWKTLYKAVESGLPIFLKIGTRPSATIQMAISGNAYPTSGQFTAPNKGTAGWTMSFQGTGKPTTSFQDYALLIDAMPEGADYPTIVNENIITT